MSTRFILGLRLSPEHHYAFKPSPCLKRVVLPLNEQIVNTIGIRNVKISIATHRSVKEIKCVLCWLKIMSY
ncbi:hypothetical protein [Shewanella morhuae]|uniref:hypothetical protein n=1 Tax=Shewanella morhuae TaxID=365591 RepID=UPI00217FB941|nr:hypothetical protein [Shewanella morhuae]